MEAKRSITSSNPASRRGWLGDVEGSGDASFQAYLGMMDHRLRRRHLPRSSTRFPRPTFVENANIRRLINPPLDPDEGEMNQQQYGEAAIDSLEKARGVLKGAARDLGEKQVHAIPR